MALKKQIVNLQNILSPSHIDAQYLQGKKGQKGQKKGHEKGLKDEMKHLSEFDKKSLQYRITSLQIQVEGLETRSSSIRKEREQERVLLIQELFTYQSCVSERRYVLCVCMYGCTRMCMYV